MTLTMTDTYNLQVSNVKAETCKLHNSQFWPCLHNANMNDETAYPGNYLRQWRKFRKLTQAQLAEAVGTTGPMIHQLENSQRGLSHKWLIRLAPALKTTPGFILDHDPNELPRDLFEIWNRGDEEERRKLTSVAEAMIPYRAKPAEK